MKKKIRQAGHSGIIYNVISYLRTIMLGEDGIILVKSNIFIFFSMKNDVKIACIQPLVYWTPSWEYRSCRTSVLKLKKQRVLKIIHWKEFYASHKKLKSFFFNELLSKYLYIVYTIHILVMGYVKKKNNKTQQKTRQ